MEVLQTTLNKRRASRSRGTGKVTDMMDRLIEVEDENGRRLDDDEIIDTLIMYLNAGHESSGHIIMWATTFLHENHEYFEKAKVWYINISEKCFFIFIL